MGSGSGQQSSSGTSQQQTQYTPSAQELKAMENQNTVYESGMPGMMKAQNAAFDASSQLLTGGSLPGFLSTLPGGITEQQNQDMVSRSLKDIQPFMGQAGLLDSGVNAAISARTAQDTRNTNAQFNINSLMQLLNIGVGGQASVTSGFTGAGASLAGLVKGTGTTNSTGSNTSNSSYSYQQPFSQTFQQMGSGFGSAMGGMNSGASAFRTMYPCWIAAEVFNGWDDIKTHLARYFFKHMAPKFMLKFYENHGERIASFIHNKPFLKALIRPFFEVFAFLGSIGSREVSHGI